MPIAGRATLRGVGYYQQSLRNPPKLESNAKANMACGAEKVRHSRAERQTGHASARNKTTTSLDAFRFLSSGRQSRTDGRGQMQSVTASACGDAGAHVHASKRPVTCTQTLANSPTIPLAGSMLIVATEPSVAVRIRSNCHRALLILSDEERVVRESDATV